MLLTEQNVATPGDRGALGREVEHNHSYGSDQVVDGEHHFGPHFDGHENAYQSRHCVGAGHHCQHYCALRHYKSDKFSA